MAGLMLLPQEVKTAPACFSLSEALATGARTPLCHCAQHLGMRVLQPGPKPF